MSDTARLTRWSTVLGIFIGICGVIGVITRYVFWPAILTVVASHEAQASTQSQVEDLKQKDAVKSEAIKRIDSNISGLRDDVRSMNETWKAIEAAHHRR